MKLLFDQNLSHHLISRLADICPGSVHARQLNLERADDETVWAYAGANGFTIISKDSDFHQRSLLFGHPPKLIWLRVGNSPTTAIERLVRDRHGEIRAFIDHPEGAFLVLS